MSSNNLEPEDQNNNNNLEKYRFLFFIASVFWTALITALPVMFLMGIFHSYWNCIPAFSLREVWTLMIAVAVTVRLVKYS